jgi:hypothetical protein
VFNAPFAAAITDEAPPTSDDSDTEESKSQMISKTGDNQSLQSEIPKPL